MRDTASAPIIVDAATRAQARPLSERSATTKPAAWSGFRARTKLVRSMISMSAEHRHKALLSYRTAGGKLTLLTSKTRQRDNAVSAACSSSRCWSSESRRS